MTHTSSANHNYSLTVYGAIMALYRFGVACTPHAAVTLLGAQDCKQVPPQLLEMRPTGRPVAALMSRPKNQQMAIAERGGGGAQGGSRE